MSVSSIVSSIVSTLTSAYSEYQASQSNNSTSENQDNSSSRYGAATTVTLSPGATAAADELDFSSTKDGVTLLLGNSDSSGIDGSYKSKAAGGYGDAEGADVSGVTVVTTTAKSDNVFGGSADEDISLGAGNDTFDTYTTNSGNDVIDGGAGNDTIYAGDGNDVLIGGTGDDDLNGEAGNDTIYGGDGKDKISGGSGNDRISGGAGDDTIDAGSGDDIISVTAGKDEVDAGSGNDTISVSAGAQAKIDGGAGTDTLELDGSAADYEISNSRSGKVTITSKTDSTFKVEMYDVENITFKGDAAAAEPAATPAPAPAEIKPVADDTKSNPHKTSASLVFGGVDSAAVRNAVREFSSGVARASDAGNKPFDIKNDTKPQSQAPAQTGGEAALEPAAQNILAQAIGQLVATPQPGLAARSYNESDRLVAQLDIKGARPTANPLDKAAATPISEQTRENDIRKAALQDKSVTSARADDGIGSKAFEKPALNDRPALAGTVGKQADSPLATKAEKPDLTKPASTASEDKPSPLAAARAEDKPTATASDKDKDADFDKPGSTDGADAKVGDRLKAARAYSRAAA